MHPAELSDEQLMQECEQRMLRRGGPGGQHRNKVETAVALTHLPTGITAEANERRSQVDNRRNAIFRLRVNLALQHRSVPPINDLTNPSERWCKRANKGRIRIGATHEDFPSLLAELLDYLTVVEFDLPRAAEHFDVTSSQLIKLLKEHPPALGMVNTFRLEHGLHKLG